MAVSDDADLIREGLRAVLRSENTSGKALEAKAAAARQLAKLDGLMPGDDEEGRGEMEPEDPMRDLDLIERARQMRRRKVLSAREYARWCRRLEADVPLDDLERDLDAADARRRRLRAVG